MFTLLGSALGFFTSFLPSVMDFFNKRQENKQELDIMSMQMDMMDKTAMHRLEAINVEADIREIESLHEHDKLTGVGFIDGLRGSVRPVITYIFMALFVFVEVSAYILLLDAGTNTLDAVLIVWDDRIMTMWAAILSFWFGSRQFQKLR